MPGPGYKRKSLPGPSRVASTGSSHPTTGVSRYASGSDAYHAAAPAPYAGYTPSYASPAAVPTSGASGVAAAAQEAAQARRQRRQKQSRQVRRKVDQERKARSGQDVKRTKAVLRDKAKLTDKQATATAPVVAKAFKRVAQPKPPKPRMVRQTNTAQTNTEDSRERLYALPNRSTIQDNPRIKTKQRKPAESPQRGLTKAKPRKVAKRLQKAVRKSTGGVPSYVPEQYKGLVSKASKKSDVPAPILSALLRQESGFQAHIGSPAGAQGIAQFMPGTAASRGVDPDNPKSAIPGAADLLRENKDHFGSWKKALAAYNAGGGAVEQYGGVPPYEETQNYVKTIMSAAREEPGKSKPIPTKLKRTARQTLGKKPTKAILKGGKIVKDPKAGKETKTRFTGRYAGSQDVVRAIVGSKVKGDHGGTKNGEAPGVHSATGDHYNPQGYAQDINGDNPSENEPPYNQETLDTIVKNLRDLGGKDVPDLKIGENWEGQIAGYQVQVLTNEGGTVNHIHVGAHPVSGDRSAVMSDPNIPIKGTKLAVKMPAEPSGSAPTSTTGGTLTASGTASGSAPAAAKAEAKTKQKAKRRRRYRNYSPYADSTSGYYSVDPETYTGDPFLQRLAELAQG